MTYLRGTIAPAVAAHIRLREMLLEHWPELADDEQTLADSLDGLSTLDDAVAAVVRSIDSDTALSTGLTKRAKEIDERKDRIEHRIETKRRLIAEAMESAGVKRITLPDATVALTTVQPKVIITDEAALPASFMACPPPPPPKPDKRRIGDALKAGETIPGATLGNPQTSIRISRK